MATEIQETPEESTLSPEENFEKQFLLTTEKSSGIKAQISFLDNEQKSSLDKSQSFDKEISLMKCEKNSVTSEDMRISTKLEQVCQTEEASLVSYEKATDSHDKLNKSDFNQQQPKDTNISTLAEYEESNKKSPTPKEVLENFICAENIERPTTSRKCLESLQSPPQSKEKVSICKEPLGKPLSEENNSEKLILQQTEQKQSTSKQIQLGKTSSSQKKNEMNTSTQNVHNLSPKNKNVSLKLKQRAHKKEKVKPPAKIIIRRLPPTMSEDEFLEQVKPLPDYDAYYYAGPDWSLGFDATCRAYFTVTNFDDVFLFCQRFDGYIFVDEKGCEYSAIVEFAPFQGLIRTRSRRDDNKVNTIEQEQHYNDFIERLKANREAASKVSEKKLEFSLDSKKEEKVTSTPLLQYLANKKEKRREDNKKRVEEKRRHREEEKEKRKQTQEHSQQVTKIISQTTKQENKDVSKEAHEDHHKNSRSKRRAERDQRRREEHELRKREREKEQREKRNTEKSENTNVTNNESNKKQINKQDIEEEKQLLKKDSKKSERVERDRERNRNRRDRRNKNKESLSNTEKSTTTAILKKSEEAEIENVNENVKLFINNVIAVKELETREQQIESLNQEEKQNIKDTVRPKLILKNEKSNKNNENIECTTELTEEMIERQNNYTDDRQLQFKEDIPNPTNKKFSQSNRNETLEDQKKQQSHRSKEEQQRRIRNKDRPSIAIYQPRARRLNDDTNSKSSNKDSFDNPTSDCENLKKDEQHLTKRIKRYSEKKAERKHELELKYQEEENPQLELTPTKMFESEINTEELQEKTS